jgi:DNA-binding transcriptional MocR family regulator
MRQSDTKGDCGPTEAKMGKADTVLNKLLGDIAKGKYPQGATLPTHRQLARENSVSLAVVNKVYQELRRRDLISAGRRKGTTIKRHVGVFPTDDARELSDSPFYDLTSSYPGIASIRNDLNSALSLELLKGDFRRTQSLTEAMSHSWFNHLSLPPDDRTALLCNGGQHALMALLLMHSQRFNTIYADEYTYVGLRLAARSLRLNLIPITVDAEGMNPRELEKGLKKTGGGMVYLMPSLQNPMSFNMTEPRAKEIAAVLEKYDCAIIEDETYRFLNSAPIASFSQRVADKTYTITTLSKLYGPEVQIGFVAAPSKASSELMACLRACSWGAFSPFSAVIGKWFEDGTYERHIALVKERVAVFQEAVARYFPADAILNAPESLFAWVKLPQVWARGGLVEYSRGQGVLTLSGRQFSLREVTHIKYMRVSGVPYTEDGTSLDAALKRLATTYYANEAALISQS